VASFYCEVLIYVQADNAESAADVVNDALSDAMHGCYNRVTGATMMEKADMRPYNPWATVTSNKGSD
jgi:2C-methyl-D-erythritol 2,4-cyclodiphosphate synthase